MKKKLLLTLLVVMSLVCLFAISASADNFVASDDNGYGTLSTVDALESSKPTSFTDYTSKVVLVGSDGKYYTFPTYYVLADNTTFTFKLNDAIKTQLGLTYSNANGLRYSVIHIQVPEGITTVGNYALEKTTTLLTVKFPSTLTSLGEGVFKSCSKLTTVENLENTKITILDASGDFSSTYNTENGVFANCSSLTALSIPKTVEKIDRWALVGCTSMTTFVIPKDSKLTIIGKYAFEDAKVLTSVDLPASLTHLEMGAFNRCYALADIDAGDTSLVTIEEYAFQGNKLTKLELPSTVTTIGKYAFAGHVINQEKLVVPNGVTVLGDNAFAASDAQKTNVDIIVMPANLTSLGAHAFEKCGTETVYIPSSVTTFSQGVFKEWPNAVTIYFTGDETTANTFKANANGTNNNPLKNSTVVSLGEYETLETKSGSYLVYGYSPCKAFYNDKHDAAQEGDNYCTGVCSRCGDTVELENPQHVNVWEFTNEEGGTASITAVIIATETCQNCKQEGEVKEIAAIFKSTGYSYEMNGNEYTGIYQRTSVDKEALALYAELTGNKDSYNFGIVAGLAADANDNPIDGNLITAINGEADVANDTTVIGTFLNTEYTIMEIKVTGVTSASQLYCGAFIVTGNDVTYLCGTTQNNVATKATFPQ